MKSTLTLTETAELTLDTLTTARRITPAKSRHLRAGQWDLFAVVGLMVCSAVYSVCAITQMTGF